MIIQYYNSCISRGQWVNCIDCLWDYVDGLVQDCNKSIANTLELLQSCIKPSMWYICVQHYINHCQSVHVVPPCSSEFPVPAIAYWITNSHDQSSHAPVSGACFTHSFIVSGRFQPSLIPLGTNSGLMQKRRNFIANTLELHLSCII